MKIKKFLSQSHIFSIYQANRFVVDEFQLRLSNHGVHLLQALILTAIFFEDKEIRPFELASTFKAEKSNLSHSLRGLEKLGLLKRAIHHLDARGYVFGLTPAGRKKAVLLIKEFDFVQNKLDSALGIKKSKDVIEGLQNVILALGI